MSVKITKYKAKGKSLVEKAIERAVLNAVGMLSRKGTVKLFEKVEQKVKAAKVATQTKKAPEQAPVLDETNTNDTPNHDVID